MVDYCLFAVARSSSLLVNSVCTISFCFSKLILELDALADDDFGYYIGFDFLELRSYMLIWICQILYLGHLMMLEWLRSILTFSYAYNFISCVPRLWCWLVHMHVFSCYPRHSFEFVACTCIQLCPLHDFDFTVASVAVSYSKCLHCCVM